MVITETTEKISSGPPNLLLGNTCGLCAERSKSKAAKPRRWRISPLVYKRRISTSPLIGICISWHIKTLSLSSLVVMWDPVTD